jgi:hypothetical protein
VVFTDLDDGSAVLLHLQTKYYYSLNETGCFLWKLLEGDKGSSEEELVSELYVHFDVEPDIARKDIRDFLKDLSVQGLIK